MHVSLDSALGRQRRLNSVGESVLQIAPNAAAAYSLRSLTGGDPTVVRVRRGSDNHEQDFTASEVSAGALTSFVNAQVVAPLDIQALEADGRTGDFLIAKAAYSLRSLGTRQATLAATGDTVARADGKYVCQVRRASDDTIKSFTADEVTDGTLVSFVTESFQKTLSVQGDGQDSTWDVTVVDNSNYTIDCNNNTSTKFCRLINSSINGGTKYRADFDFTTNSGDASNLKLNRSSPFLFKNIVEGSNSIEFDFTESTLFMFRISAGSNVFNATISNLTVTAIGNDGHVKTWYDQSVTNQAGDTATGNHATQATAASQPKIVSAGALVTGGIDFDGTANRLEIDFGSNLSQPNSIVMVHQSSTTVDVKNEFFDELGATGQRTLLDQSSTNYRIFAGSSATTNLAVDTNKNLITAIYNGASSIVAKNGTAQSGLNGNTQSISSTSAIGFSESTAAYYQGAMQEFIVYNSDQTDNRTAIEANIGEAYSIDLPSGVDPGFDQVDGFVETWYDQSGNGRDATQATAGSQPKIVDEGALVTSSGLASIEFDGTDDTLIADSVASVFSGTDKIWSHFSVTEFNSSAVIAASLGNSSTSSQFIYSGLISSKYRFYVRDSFSSESIINSGTLSLNTPYLNHSTTNGATQAQFVNSNAAGTNSLDTGAMTFNQFTLGAFRITTTSTFMDGSISEFIIHNTDQSSNRTAIESNINSHYSIF